MCDKISEIDNLLTDDGQAIETSLRLEILDVNEMTFKQRLDNLLNNELNCRENRYLLLCFRVTAATWVFVFGWLLNDLIDDGAIDVNFMVSQPSWFQGSSSSYDEMFPLFTRWWSNLHEFPCFQGLNDSQECRQWLDPTCELEILMLWTHRALRRQQMMQPLNGFLMQRL